MPLVVNHLSTDGHAMTFIGSSYLKTEAPPGFRFCGNTVGGWPRKGSGGARECSKFAKGVLRKLKKFIIFRKDFSKV